MNFDFKGIQKISTNMMNEFRLIPGSVVELAMPAAQLQMVTSYIRNIPSPLPFGDAHYAARIWWNLKLCFSPGGVYHGPCLSAKRSSCAVFQFWLNENLYKQLLCSLQLNLNWNPDHCLSSVKPSIGIYAGSAEPLLFFKIIGTNYVKRILGCSDECDVFKKKSTHAPRCFNV